MSAYHRDEVYRVSISQRRGISCQHITETRYIVPAYHHIVTLPCCIVILLYRSVTLICRSCSCFNFSLWQNSLMQQPETQPTLSSHRTASHITCSSSISTTVTEVRRHAVGAQPPVEEQIVNPAESPPGTSFVSVCGTDYRV